MSDQPPISSTKPAEPPHAWRYLARALRLRCPECGRHPIFIPARKVRSLFDWFSPLDGCPHCGYAYEREEGYFMIAIWVVNYGLVAAIGLTAGMLLQAYSRLSLWSIMALLLVTMPLTSLLLARHAKAFFLAIDHYFDPHVNAKDDPPKSHQ
jgi:uncharacterized protein (DUF983 family)